MRKFIQRASDFLGFRRSFVGLIEEGKVEVRWSYDEGKHGPAGYVIPEGILTRAMRNKEVFWGDDATELLGANQQMLAEFKVRQFLAVPLLGTGGEPLCMFGVLDRLEQSQIAQEDIRRAQAVAAQVTVALEVSRNLHVSEQHRQRAESLTSLALEMNSLLRGPEFAHRFVERAAGMMEAKDAALLVESGHDTVIVVLRALARADTDNKQLKSRFSRAAIAAISGFIVAHDECGNIRRVNRSLPDFIGVQPQQLIGLNMGALLATGGNPPSRSCPFCRSTGNVTDEYMHPVLERTFLVSTSQVHAASSEGLQTIHVLKDITDRREAERRYRELFDNIQEGLFFCSPDGRFIEVNDALVRMLGHSSRDELLHCDPREEVFSAPERHLELFVLIEKQGTLRNPE